MVQEAGYGGGRLGTQPHRVVDPSDTRANLRSDHLLDALWTRLLAARRRLGAGEERSNPEKTERDDALKAMRHW
jgi:hypothetical protein